MKQGLVHALILCAVVAIVFGSTAAYPFLSWDDPINVTENPLVLGATGAGLARAWHEAYAGLYVPVAYTWYWFLAKLSGGGGPDPVLFHAGNLVLHALAALLLQRLLTRLSGNARAALAGALVFAVHPLVVESVAWVTEARGLLAACFSLAALVLALEGLEHGGGREWVRPIVRQVLATLCCACALLSKPQAAALPLVLLLLARVFSARTGETSRARRVWPLAAAWGILAVLAFALTKSLQTDDSMRAVTSVGARPLVALDALGFYAWRTILPVGLATDYGRTPEWLLESVSRAWPAALFLLLVALFLALRRLRSFVPGLAWFTLALLPVAGLVPFVYQDVSTTADRYAYPALFGVAWIVAHALARASAGVQGTVAVLVCVPLATLSVRQCDTWRDESALFGRVLEENPRSWKAYSNLGFAEARAGKLDAAVADYRRSLQLGPTRWIVHQNLGHVLARQEKYAEAEVELARSYELRRENLEVAAQLGAVRMQLGRFADAEEPLRTALALAPERADVLQNLGTILLALGRDEEAVERLRASLARYESPEARKNLAQALVLRHDVRGAIAELEAALKARLKWPDAQTDLAWLLATAEEDALRDGPRAFALISEVLTATQSPTVLQVDTLAAAQAAVGRFDDAARTLDQLLQAVGDGDAQMHKSLEARRAAYREKRAWRGSSH